MSKVEQVIAWLLITIGGLGFLTVLYGWIFRGLDNWTAILYALVCIIFIRLAPIVAKVLTSYQ